MHPSGGDVEALGVADLSKVGRGALDVLRVNEGRVDDCRSARGQGWGARGCEGATAAATCTGSKFSCNTAVVLGARVWPGRLSGRLSGLPACLTAGRPANSWPPEGWLNGWMAG